MSRVMRCHNCLECEYIGDGDYACMKSVPVVVLTEHGTPTDDYMWCKKGKTVQIIKVKFLKLGKPSGREYTYFSPVDVAVGNTVQINASATGVVTAVDVSEKEIAPYRDKVKTIIGKVEEK